MITGHPVRDIVICICLFVILFISLAHRHDTKPGADQ